MDGEWSWATVNGQTEPETLEEAVHQTVGAGSMCWIGGPSGVFDDQGALAVSEQLTRWITARYVRIPA